MIILCRNPLKFSSTSCISCVLAWTFAFDVCVCVCVYMCANLSSSDRGISWYFHPHSGWWSFMTPFRRGKSSITGSSILTQWIFTVENQWPRGWRDSYLFGSSASFWRCLLYDWYGIISVHVLICMMGNDGIIKSINRLSLHQGHKKLSLPPKSMKNILNFCNWGIVRGWAGGGSIRQSSQSGMVAAFYI